MFEFYLIMGVLIGGVTVLFAAAFASIEKPKKDA
jgi:hypothetical protein